MSQLLDVFYFYFFIWICIPASQAWYCKQIAIHIHPYTPIYNRYIYMYIYICIYIYKHSKGYSINLTGLYCLSLFEGKMDMYRWRPAHVPSNWCRLGSACGGCYSFLSSLVDGKSLKSWNRLNRTYIYM